MRSCSHRRPGRVDRTVLHRSAYVAFALFFACAALQVPAATVAQAPSPGPTAPPAPSSAETDCSAKVAAIEKEIDAMRKELHIPGAALVIVQDDRVIYLKGLGLRDIERNLPVTTDTLFAIGSSSKAFTAMAVMMSVDDGKLSLSDSPKKYLPYFQLRDPEADARITVSDLLCHRSGLGRTDLAWATGVLRARDVIRVAGVAKPTAKLGEKFQYQNVMYLAAGEVVAKVQKASWGKVIARHIFEPLGMRASNTSIREMQRAPDHALGYSYDTETKQTKRLPMRNLSSIAPAGAINSNARDMAQWLRLMLGGGVYAGRRLVTEKSFAELSVPRVKIAGDALSYGYGWMLREWHGHKVLEHGGSIDGFNAQVALMPDRKLGFVLLTNVSFSPLGTLAMNTVWENLVGRPPAPAASTASTDDASAPTVDLASEAGTYRLTEANIDLVVTIQDGKLTLQAPGQPVVPLENVGGRRYKIGPPAPPESFVTFRRGEKDPQAPEMLLEQGGGSLRLVLPKRPAEKPADFTPPLSVEALMEKVIDAAGGEANLRKHRTMVMEVALDLENQGLTGEGTLYVRAPNHSASKVTLFGAGRKIATMREYHDGSQAGYEASFAIAGSRTGNSLADAAIAAEFYPELNWSKLFKTVTIQSLSKVGDEEAYMVEKIPEKGNKVTDYISTRTFLLLKRDSQTALPGLDASLSLSETFHDYRAVDGVMVSFRRVQTHPEVGTTVLTVKKVRYDAPVRDDVFRPGPKK